MGVYTFVCRTSGSDWNAKQLSGDLEASAGSSYDLERKLVQAALSSDSGVVQSSFSLITPSSAVCQVVIGGAVASGFVSAGAAPAAAAGGGAAAEAPKAEEKTPEKEESDEEDFGMNLFD